MIIFFTCIFYVSVGALAGFLGGLLGIGGGLITVPSLLLIFQLLDCFGPDRMHVAIGTSLGSMIFTTATSAYMHYLNHGIHWQLFRFLLLAIFLGSVLGAMIAIHLPGKMLELIFSFCMCFSGIYFLLSKNNQEEQESVTYSHPIIFTFVGITISMISTILGIGGGIITVPALTALQVSLRRAISTSAISSFLIACIGALSFLTPGLGRQPINGNVGYLYLPAFLVIGITSSLLAFYGAKKAYALPIPLLKRGFGVVLLVVGILMFFLKKYL